MACTTIQGDKRAGCPGGAGPRPGLRAKPRVLTSARPSPELQRGNTARARRARPPGRLQSGAAARTAKAGSRSHPSRRLSGHKQTREMNTLPPSSAPSSRTVSLAPPLQAPGGPGLQSHLPARPPSHQVQVHLSRTPFLWVPLSAATTLEEHMSSGSKESRSTPAPLRVSSATWQVTEPGRFGLRDVT